MRGDNYPESAKRKASVELICDLSCDNIRLREDNARLRQKIRKLLQAQTSSDDITPEIPESLKPPSATIANA